VAREGVERVRAKHGDGDYWNVRWRGVTLTMPLMVGAELKEAIETINAAFRLLTNRKFWKSRVKGGIKGIEFTIRPNGYHVHIHALILSEFMPVDSANEKKWRVRSHHRKLSPGNLRGEFTECLRSVGASVGEHLFVHVKDARRRDDRKDISPRYVELDAALMECAKYLTKNTSWDKITNRELVKLAEVERWGRMFELLRDARPPRKDKSGSEATEPANAENEHSTGDVDEAIQAAKDSTSSVHQDGIVTSGVVRRVTWRDRLKEMEWVDWANWLLGSIERAREYRREQSKYLYPLAIFKTLSGDVWGIVSCEL
jgi:hypothetical protein